MATPLDRNRFDPSFSGIHFEKHGIIDRWLRRHLVSKLNQLSSKWGARVFTLASFGGDTATVSATVRTHKALEVMYGFTPWNQLLQWRFWRAPSDIFWQTFLSNARSIRNRLMLTEWLLGRAREDVASRKEEARFASLACGSARATIDILSQNTYNGAHAYLLDMSPDALEYARELAVKRGVSHRVTTIEGNILRAKSEFTSELNGSKLDVVEAVGILDYLSNKAASLVFRQVYDLLESDGYFVTGNIRPNDEQQFVTKGIGWDQMIYRTEGDLTSLLVQAGFSEENTLVIPEPLGVHLLVIAKKE